MPELKSLETKSNEVTTFRDRVWFTRCSAGTAVAPRSSPTKAAKKLAPSISKTQLNATTRRENCRSATTPRRCPILTKHESGSYLSAHLQWLEGVPLPKWHSPFGLQIINKWADSVRKQPSWIYWILKGVYSEAETAKSIRLPQVQCQIRLQLINWTINNQSHPANPPSHLSPFQSWNSVGNYLGYYMCKLQIMSISYHLGLAISASSSKVITPF